MRCLFHFDIVISPPRAAITPDIERGHMRSLMAVQVNEIRHQPAPTNENRPLHLRFKSESKGANGSTRNDVYGQLAPIATLEKDFCAEICIIGLGYVGLPLAALLADKDIKVAGCDIRSEVINSINSGKVRIAEPHLDDLVAKVSAAGHLHAFDTPQRPMPLLLLSLPPMTKTIELI